MHMNAMLFLSLTDMHTAHESDHVVSSHTSTLAPCVQVAGEVQAEVIQGYADVRQSRFARKHDAVLPVLLTFVLGQGHVHPAPG